jgi:hypothetical protein
MRRHLILSFSWLAVVCAHAGTESGSLILSGRVQRANHDGVANAWVVLVEEPKRFPLDLTLKDARKIAAVKTDGAGRFKIKVSSIANRKLILSVLGEPIVKNVAGTREVTGTDIGTRDISTEKPNVLVVPNGFKPSSKPQKIDR